jgi:16S rRNA (guanine966-N2)-methyltransferase
MQRTQLRIVAGSLRGRRLTVNVHEGLRPTPQMVREALFSILGNAVPGRPFLDVFAGTGVVGLEAISRGATVAVFVERDFRLATDIDGYLAEFGVTDRGQVVRTDVYRWAERWVAPREPVNVFLSPPFPDLTRRADDFLGLVRGLAGKAAAGSVLVVQAETGFSATSLPEPEAWDERKYGRNLLLIWVKPGNAGAAPEPGAGGSDTPPPHA